MKSQKGMSYPMLIIYIIIIIAIIITVGYFAYKQIEERILENYQETMISIQIKTKILSQESIMQKNEELLKGRKVSDSLEEEQIKTILEKGVISQEEDNFSKYYIIEKSTLEEMELNNIELEEGNYYIVNYDTYEIIYANGININNNTYYKLSELKELNKTEEETKEKEETEQVDQTQEVEESQE